MNIVKGPITGTEYDDDLPSGRILFALEAMRYFERTPGLDIDMDHFRFKTQGTCYACFGGAAHSVKNNRIKRRSFIDQRVKWPDYYEISLDSVRKGNLQSMLYHMNIEPSDETIRLEEDLRITDYEVSPTAFYEVLTSLAESLAKLGY